VGGFEERNDILHRRISLEIMRGAEDVAAAAMN
jgi:hypothetical protein